MSAKLFSFLSLLTFLTGNLKKENLISSILYVYMYNIYNKSFIYTITHNSYNTHVALQKNRKKKKKKRKNHLQTKHLIEGSTSTKLLHFVATRDKIKFKMERTIWFGYKQT